VLACGIVVLKACDMFLWGAKCTACCTVKSTMVESLHHSTLSKKPPDDDPRIETRVGVQF
jgi:hypothetical protein